MWTRGNGKKIGGGSREDCVWRITNGGKLKDGEKVAKPGGVERQAGEKMK